MSTMSAATAALALALGLAFVAGAAAQSGPQTCPAQCTCSCPSPRPPSPFPPPPKSPSPKPPSPKPPSPKPPTPPSPKPSPKPPARSPPPPPPLTPPPRCNFNNVRSLAKCSQRTASVPYELDDDFNCAPIRESNRDYLGCTFTIEPKSCPSGDCAPMVPRSLYLLADQVNCRSKIDKAIVTFPDGTKDIVSGHWEQDTCLRKYSLTTSPDGVPIGSNVTVLFPARGECSDPLEVCRPGKIDGANACKAAVADYEFEFCAFKDVEKA